ncbi:unnamed protein product [Nezara viridula]|uniref:Uncharacterized protein n=1 Tax=Nezara viridula TaxID=85310 RepID=A0A9P0HC03_NEZVI|nr:unnamed protein product [Nezara viridula]
MILSAILKRTKRNSNMSTRWIVDLPSMSPDNPSSVNLP